MLRPYQDAALKACVARYDAGVYRQLISLPTGSGKTVVFANVPEYFGFRGTGKKMLVLVHREELADQAAAKLRHWNSECKVGVEMADRYSSPNDDLIVASVQTLGRKGSPRLARLNPADFAAVVVDEAHHAVATTYTNILRHFGFMDIDKQRRLLLGVTATPTRGDGKALSEVFDEIPFNHSLRQMIEEGWLADIRGVRVTSKTSLDKVRIVAGDFAVNDLSNEVNTSERNALIVKSYIDYAPARKAIVFCVDIAHSKGLAHAFQMAGVQAEAIWGDDPDRGAKLARHRRGDTRVLTNCAILTEGYDDPGVDCVIMARPTKSQLLFVQCTGRGMRIPADIQNLHEARKAGTKITKEDCLFIDIVDNTSRHCLVTTPSLLGLNTHMDLQGKSLTVVAKKIEEEQKKNPTVDFGKLTDPDNISTYAESVNLFEVRVPQELLEASKLRWTSMTDGSYVLAMPNRESVVITTNTLGQFDVVGQVNESAFGQSELSSLESAIDFSETMLKTLGGTRQYRIMQRDWKSGDQPMTFPQRGLLLSLLRTKVLPQQYADATKQQASNAISNLMAGRA